MLAHTRCTENVLRLCLREVLGASGTHSKKTVPAMKFFFRMLSLLALSAAIVTGALDSIQSVSSSSVVLTSLGNHWLNFDVESLALAEEAIRHYIHPNVWRVVATPVLAQPAFAVFLVLALVFWMIGYRRPRFAGRFSA